MAKGCGGRSLPPACSLSCWLRLARLLMVPAEDSAETMEEKLANPKKKKTKFVPLEF